MSFRDRYREVLNQHTEAMMKSVVDRSVDPTKESTDYYHRSAIRSHLDRFALDVLRAAKEKA